MSKRKSKVELVREVAEEVNQETLGKFVRAEEISERIIEKLKQRLEK